MNKTKPGSFIGNDGSFKQISVFLDDGLLSREQLFDVNTDLIKRALGADTIADTGLAAQAMDLLLTFSLDSTLSAWDLSAEGGGSGVSSKKMIGDLELAPGAILMLVHLLRIHPKAAMSGSLSIGWTNPDRSRSGRR